MYKVGFKPDKVWGRTLIEATKEINAVMAGIMLSQFDDLLMGSAQRSGEYVANFRIAVGYGMDGYQAMPAWRKDNWFAKGYAEAINIAKAHNSGVKAAARGGGIFGASTGRVVLHNLSEHAEEAAGQEGRPAGTINADDPGNVGSDAALQKFKDAVTAITSKRIYVGKGTWNMYRDLDI
jgi:hypothetical protein